MRWLIREEDTQQILREEMMRRDAVDWVLTFTGSDHVFQRYTTGKGNYTYVVGDKMEGQGQELLSYDITREDVVSVEPEFREPLYPYPNDPFRDREDSE